MAILERIIRIFLGGRAKSCPLAEVFENETIAERAVVLEETGFPYGGITKYTWWKSSGSGFFKKVHKRFSRTDPNPNVPTTVQSTAVRVDELLSLIEEYDDLNNYSGNVRDGVVYRVAWGSKDRQRTLTIANPPADSKHYQLVSRLKESAMSWSGESNGGG